MFKSKRLFGVSCLIFGVITITAVLYGFTISKYSKMDEKQVAAVFTGKWDNVKHHHYLPFAFETHFYLTRRSPEDVDAFRNIGGHILWMGGFNRHPGLSKRIAKFYMQRDLDINETTPILGMNALHWVSNGNLADAAQWLLDNGADPSIKSVADPDTGFSPYGTMTALEMVRERVKVHKKSHLDFSKGFMKDHKAEIEGLWDNTLAVLEAHKKEIDGSRKEE